MLCLTLFLLLLLPRPRRANMYNSKAKRRNLLSEAPLGNEAAVISMLQEPCNIIAGVRAFLQDRFAYESCLFLFSS
jgi:hypothetical protein